MERRDDPNLILAYVEGELPEADAQRFEARCRADASLAALVRDLQADRAALRGLPQEAPSADNSPADVAVGQIERSLLLGDQPEAAQVASSHGGSAGVFRILRYASYAGLAAALGLTAIVVVNNLTGTPLGERGRDLAVAPMEPEVLGDTTGDEQAFAFQETVPATETESLPAADTETLGMTIPSVTQGDQVAVASTPVTVHELQSEERLELALRAAPASLDPVARESDTLAAESNPPLLVIDDVSRGVVARETTPEAPAFKATANSTMGLGIRADGSSASELFDAETDDAFMLAMGSQDRAALLRRSESATASPTASNAMPAWTEAWPASEQAPSQTAQTLVNIERADILGRQPTRVRVQEQSASTKASFTQIPLQLEAQGASDPTQWLKLDYWFPSPIPPQVSIPANPTTKP
ncbi:MAG: hypothetical protein AAGJ38_05430 [Planctomycetota bacterium]